MVNEVKNSAFGEIRYQFGSMPTGYTYRGNKPGRAQVSSAR
jgi:hypothetical protein